MVKFKGSTQIKVKSTEIKHIRIFFLDETISTCFKQNYDY